MARDAFGDRGEVGGLLDGALEGGGMSVVSVEGASARIGREVGGGEGTLRGARPIPKRRTGTCGRARRGDRPKRGRRQSPVRRGGGSDGGVRAGEGGGSRGAWGDGL